MMLSSLSSSRRERSKKVRGDHFIASVLTSLTPSCRPSDAHKSGITAPLQATPSTLGAKLTTTNISTSSESVHGDTKYCIARSWLETTQLSAEHEGGCNAGRRLRDARHENDTASPSRLRRRGSYPASWVSDDRTLTLTKADGMA